MPNTFWPHRPSDAWRPSAATWCAIEGKCAAAYTYPDGSSAASYIIDEGGGLLVAIKQSALQRLSKRDAAGKQLAKRPKGNGKGGGR